jgi:hypothetical protein
VSYCKGQNSMVMWPFPESLGSFWDTQADRMREVMWGDKAGGDRELRLCAKVSWPLWPRD